MARVSLALAETEPTRTFDSADVSGEFGRSNVGTVVHGCQTMRRSFSESNAQFWGAPVASASRYFRFDGQSP
jgi:hypothetical protein